MVRCYFEWIFSLWSNLQATFFQGVFWDLAVGILETQRHTQVQCWGIVNSETRTTSILRYWKFKDIHCSLATASQGALSDRWLKGAWMAARYVFSSTVGMVWFGHGMVWHGGHGETIYKANVGAWRTHNKDGWSEVHHSLIWQCKLLLWLWIEFSPWNN